MIDPNNIVKSLALDSLTAKEQLEVLAGIEKTIKNSRVQRAEMVKSNVDVVINLLKKIEADIKSRYDAVGNKIEQRVASIKDGRDGRDGKDGKDGKTGPQGPKGDRGIDGKDGKDGAAGQDGVSVTDAKIDFDGSLVITLSNGREINVGEVVSTELAEKIKVTMSTNAALTVQDEGTTLTSGARSLNFTGSGVTATASGDSVTINFTGGGGTPGGANTQVQYNSGGAFAGSANMTFNGTNLTLGGDAYIAGHTVGRGGGSVSNNIAIGSNALVSNTSGGSSFGDIIAIGRSSLASNTFGYQNLAIGQNALYSNDSGGDNVAAGNKAQEYMKGNFNTSIGVLALRGSATPANNTGQFNVAVGYGALNNITSGSTNVAIGNQSGTAITSGSNHTIIGAYSGNQGGLDIRTASNYVVLSDGAGNPRAYWNGANATFNGNLSFASGSSIAGGVERQLTNVALSGLSSTTVSSIPSWVTRVKLTITGSFNTTNAIIYFRLAGSSGIETSGYVSSSQVLYSSGGAGTIFLSSYTTGFGMYVKAFNNFASSGTVIVELVKQGSTNTWAFAGQSGVTQDLNNTLASGFKVITGSLTQVQVLALTSALGVTTFTTSTLAISYMG